MTDIANLTTRLRSLRRTRSLLAWTKSLAAVMGIALWSLIAAFAIDVTLQMRLIERTFVLVICLGILVWACWRFLSRVLLRRDSLVDMALLTEQQQGIASDLVAALQFADPTRRQFGLDELRAAVIGDTAELTDSLEIRCGYSWNDFRRRTWIVLVAGAVIGMACWLCGGHVEAFAKRFLLGDVPYPTRTTIRVTAPGDHAGFGQPVAFVVEASGRLPDDGTVHIVGDAGGETTVVRLAPDVQTASTYVGQLPRAIDSFSFVVELGDARSQEHTVRVLPLPKVIVELDITTPEYAVNKLGGLGQLSGQHAAFAGSRVVPVVTADKKLRRATIDINGKSFAMTPRGSAFVLDTSDRLLARLSESLRYQVQVEDVDGLKLERPTGGVLRVIPDRPPMVTCSTVSAQVLPTAAPMIHVAASDDFGIRRVVLHGTVIRQTETGQETAGPAQAVHELRDPGASVDRAVTIDVSKLDLAVGDRLICVAEVTDDRGGLPSESASSPPLMFEIVDRETVLANLRDIGTKMDSKLNDIIQTQSNLGER